MTSKMAMWINVFFSAARPSLMRAARAGIAIDAMRKESRMSFFKVSLRCGRPPTGVGAEARGGLA